MGVVRFVQQGPCALPCDWNRLDEYILILMAMPKPLLTECLAFNIDCRVLKCIEYPFLIQVGKSEDLG